MFISHYMSGTNLYNITIWKRIVLQRHNIQQKNEFKHWKLMHSILLIHNVFKFICKVHLWLSVLYRFPTIIGNENEKKGKFMIFI